MIISGIIIGVIVIAIIIFINVMRSGVTGEFDFVSGDDGCFTEINFTDGPPSARVVSFSEVIGSTKKVFLGPLKIEGNTMRIKVDNFENIEPLDMNYELKDDQLVVKYPWENNEYVCTYERKK